MTKSLILSIALLISLPIQLSAQGATYKTGTTVRINATDTLSNNVIIAGQLVEVIGAIDNDLFSASRQLIIDGSIADDAIIAAQMLTMRGFIGDMLLGAAETVVIDGVIEGDLFAAGRTIRITGNAHVHGNALLAAETLIIEGGTIDGWMRGAGSELRLNGTFGNFVELYSEDITFEKGYDAAYSTSIYSESEIYRENLGFIPDDLHISVRDGNYWWAILGQLWFFLSLLITGLILIRIFHTTAIDLERFSIEKFWKNTGIGLLSFILIPITILVLVLLVLTIPLAMITALLYGLGLVISYLLVAMVLGVSLIRFFSEPPAPSSYYWGLGLGMIIIAILVNLPFIGFLIHLLLLFFGLGSLIYYLWNMSRMEHQVTNGPE